MRSEGRLQGPSESEFVIVVRQQHPDAGQRNVRFAEEHPNFVSQRFSSLKLIGLCKMVEFKFQFAYAQLKLE